MDRIEIICFSNKKLTKELEKKLVGFLKDNNIIVEDIAIEKIDTNLYGGD